MVVAGADTSRDRGPTSIALVYGIDNRFALPLAASIASALDHLATDHRLDIYVIDGGLSRRNRSRVERSFQEKSCRIQWIRPPHRKLLALKVGGDITVAAYYRVLIPDLLPSSYQRAIYLDADVIVQGDLAKLWQLPLGDHHLLAVQDQGIRLISGPYGLKSYKTLGIPESAKYFNSGVLVFNLEKWRQDQAAERVLDHVRRYPHDGICHDQDGLNAMLWNSWAELDPRWNQMRQVLQAKTAAESPFDLDTYRNVVRDPFIIHYSSADKPWRFGCQHPATALFFHHLDRTAYRGFRPTRWHTRFNDIREFFRKRLTRLRDLARVGPGP